MILILMMHHPGGLRKLIPTLYVHINIFYQVINLYYTKCMCYTYLTQYSYFTYKYFTHLSNLLCWGLL